jgi:hypothetical protein
MPIDSRRVIKGEFGEIWKDGVHLSNFYSAELTADITYDDVKRSGTRTTGNKVGTIKYSGTITGYKITSELVKQIAQVTNDAYGAFVCELIFKVADPENGVTQRLRVKGVQFTKIDYLKFDHGSIVEEELPFVCDGVEWITG